MDLILNFRKCIYDLYEKQVESDRDMRNKIMKAQDRINSRIQTFPIPNVDKLDDLDLEIPKLISFNKQMYEIMFALLQTHPCYLINWINASICNEVDLYDDHPQAFNDEDPLVEQIKKAQDQYINLPEQLVQANGELYLITCVFGGLKSIRDN